MSKNMNEILLEQIELNATIAQLSMAERIKILEHITGRFKDTEILGDNLAKIAAKILSNKIMGYRYS